MGIQMSYLERGDLDRFIKETENVLLACDTETDDLDQRKAKLYCITLSDGKRGWYIRDDVIFKEKDKMRVILSRPMIYHNFPYDGVVLYKNLGVWANLKDDTMAQANVLVKALQTRSLKELVKILLNHTMKTYKEAFSFITPLYGVNHDAIFEYAIEDAVWTYRLWEYFQKMECSKEKKFLVVLDREVCKVVVKLMCESVKVDVEEMERQGQMLTEKIDRLRHRIYKEIGTVVNLNSNQQMSQILFDKLGLTPVGERGKAGFYSVDKKVLSKLDHPVAQMLLEYKEALKLQRDFFDKYARIGEFSYDVNLYTIESGRLAISDPNVNQIPKKVRVGFIPKEGCYFVQVDLAQVELVLLLILSGCHELLDMWIKGEDLHRYNAAKVFKCRPEEVTPEQRFAVKTITYRFSYGGGPQGLADQLNISLEEAVDLTEQYFAAVPELRNFQRRLIQQAKDNGGVVTDAFGRTRIVSQLRSNEFRTRRYGERVVLSQTIQGSAAQLFRIQLVKAMKLWDKGIKLKIPVHDSILFEVEKKWKVKDAVELILKTIAVDFKGVAMRMDAEVGYNWYQMVPVQDENVDLIQACLDMYDVKKWRECWETIKNLCNVK